jgi:hypothetical protein
MSVRRLKTALPTTWRVSIKFIERFEPGQRQPPLISTEVSIRPCWTPATSHRQDGRSRRLVVTTRLVTLDLPTHSRRRGLLELTVLASSAIVETLLHVAPVGLGLARDASPDAR